MNVLLVNPPTSALGGQRYDSDMPPLGLAYMAASLRRGNFNVDILDMSVGDDPAKELEAKLIGVKLVGITCFTENFSLACQIARVAKGYDPSIVTVIGGPHASFTIQETLQYDAFDIVVSLEGEVTFAEIVEHLREGKPSLQEIKGIAFREGDRIILNSSRPRIDNLDGLAFPAYDLLPMEHYKRSGAIISSRGCPYNCIFCLAKKFEGEKYRFRTAKNLLMEMKELHNQYGLSKFYFVDDSFTINTKRVKEICDLIRRSRLDVEWICATRVDVIDISLLKTMRGAGCVAVEFGVESGDSEVLKKIRKKIEKQWVRDVVRAAARNGIQPICNFLLGHPHDTWQSMMKTLNFARELFEDGSGVNFSVVTPFPGTPIYSHAREFGIEIKSNSWDDFRLSNPVFDSRYLTREEIREALIMAALMR